MLRPEIDFAYFQEIQAEYVDINGITIPALTISMGCLSFGPEIAIPIIIADGMIEPVIGMFGVWDFTSGDLSARLQAGIRFSNGNAASLTLSGGYAGLFIPDFSSWNVRAGLTIPLQ